MKRGLLALGILLGVAVVQARADYVILLYNAGQQKDPGMAQMGAAGQMGAMGIPGFGAAGPGARGGAGAMGALGGPPGLGMGGAVGIPPGFGVMGGGAAGDIGVPGAGGAMGALGGPPGFGVMGAGAMGGAIGIPGLGFTGFTGGLVDTSSKSPPLRVMAVVESKKPVFVIQPSPATLGKLVVRLDHKWGASYVWGNTIDEIILLTQRNGRALPSVTIRFEAERQKINQRGKASTRDQIALAQWALEHGLLTQFEKTMDELAKNDPADPTVAVYTKVREALAQKPSSDDTALWKKKVFDSHRTALSDHYVLFHTSARDETAEVKSRLARLEETFKAFYYWHALHGKALPVPRKRLMAVVESANEQPSDAYLKQVKRLEARPIHRGSALAPRQNVIVFAGSRIDQPYEVLTRSTEKMWAEYDPDGIIAYKPSGFPRGVPYISGPSFEAQSLALLTKALKDDAEVAAATFDGTRQLLAGAELLPGNVAAPQWIHAGMGSLFQTPAGSPWRMYGAPHWAHYFTFKKLKTDKKLPGDFQLLKDVVTDRYFIEGSKEKGTPVKGRSTAWALTYFLATKKLDQLHAYFRELSRMPRDLEFDTEALLDCFARAFGYYDVKTRKRDDGALSRLASEWVSAMDDVALDNEAQPMFEKIFKLQNELEEELREGDKPKPVPGGGGGVIPGFPGFPGGPRPPGVPGQGNRGGGPAN